MHDPGVRERVADQGWRVPQLQHTQVILDVVANQNLILPNNTHELDNSTLRKPYIIFMQISCKQEMQT